jgi:hypothetical protein
LGRQHWRRPLALRNRFAAGPGRQGAALFQCTRFESLDWNKGFVEKAGDSDLPIATAVDGSERREQLFRIKSPITVI